MPIAVIPFKAPPPFELPTHLQEALGAPPFEAAGHQALAILEEAGAGDLLFLVRRAEGLGPFIGVDAAADGVLSALAAQSDALEFVSQALSATGSLLWMGELTQGEPCPFPDVLTLYWLAGDLRRQLGFLYAFPWGAGPLKAGALFIHRPLEAGPMNHDMPAIAQALAQALGQQA
jgi:hypothetical protein